jgi:hypothetical protein
LELRRLKVQRVLRDSSSRSRLSRGFFQGGEKGFNTASSCFREKLKYYQFIEWVAKRLNIICKFNCHSLISITVEGHSETWFEANYGVSLYENISLHKTEER